MAQKKYSLPEFAANIRRQTGHGREMTDTQLVRAWVSEFPGDKEHLDDPTGMLGAIETAQGLLGGGDDPPAPTGPKPLPLEGEAAKIGTTKTDLVKNVAFEPILPHVSKLPIWARPLNIGPVGANPALLYAVARELSSPVDVASLASLGGAGLAAKYGAKGLAKVAPIFDRAASGTMLGVGASDVIDAATNSNISPSDRLLKGGVGALLGVAGLAGLRNPIGTPRPVPGAAIPTPRPPEPLALPAIGGTTPTATRFYAGPAGIADVTQQYPVHLPRPGDPLLGNPDTAATATLGEIGQMRNLPPIEAARGPRLSGLHGTGAPLAPESGEAIFARQIADIMRNSPPPRRGGLPPASSPSVTPPSGAVQTGIGGKVDFGSSAAKGVPVPGGEVLPAVPGKQKYLPNYFYLEDGSGFPTIDEAIEAAMEAGWTKIGEPNAKGTTLSWVPFDDAGFAKGNLLRPLAGSMAGGLTGAAAGNTPGEKVGYGVLGAVGGGVLGAPRRTGRFLKNTAAKIQDAAYKPTQLNLPPIGKPPIKAFHGTPHKFDKFDISKIGTGEGAQAYGRGLYFAGEKDVARQYRDNLSGTDVLLNGRVLPDDVGITTPESLAARYIRANSGNIDYAIEDLKSAARLVGGNGQTHKAALDFIEANKAGFKIARKGNVLETQIKANPNHLIDWDKPFDAQPEYVRKKLAKILDIDSAALRAWSGRDIYKALARQESMSLAPRKLEGKLSTEADVVELLRKNGIKGIKYLDGNSRRAVGKVIDISPNPEVTNGWVLTYDQNGTYKLKSFGSKEEAEGWAARNLTPEGTSNYVVFDDKLIDIVGREEGFIENVLMRRMAGGAAGALTGGAIGETPEEKLKLAAVGGFMGAALPRSAARVPRRVPHVTTEGQDLLLAQAKEGKKGEDSILGLGTKLNRNLVTRFAPHDKLDAAVEKSIGRKLTATERSGDTNRRVFGGQSGKTRAAMLDLEDIVKSTSKAGIDEEVRNYMNMKGMIHAYDSLLRKAGKLTGAERKELLRRLEAGEVFPRTKADGKPFTIKDINDAIRLAETSPQFTKVKEAADKVFQFNRDTLDMLYRDGVISKEGYDELVGRGIEYVPQFRRGEGGLIEGAGNDLVANLERELIERGTKAAGLSLKRTNAIKALYGSERITQDPYQASLYLRQVAEREIGRNEAARTLYKLREIDPEGAGKMIVPLGAAGGKKKSPPPGYGEITFRQDGEVVSFAVPKEIAEMQLLIDGKALVAGISALGDFLSGGKGILQATATAYNPIFTAFNIQRDFRTARLFLKSNKMGNLRSYAESLNEWRKALASRLKQDEHFREALRSRSLQGTLQETILPTPIIVGGPKVGPLKRAVNTVAELSRVMEETTKLMAYNQMKKHLGAGANADEIAQEVRRFGGSPDFADSGTKISEGWNLAFVFLNPAIQGIAQNVRGIKRMPLRAAGKLGAAVAGSIALYNWNNQWKDENGRPEIEHVPKFDRDSSFVIILPWKDAKTGRHLYLTVLRKSHADRLFYNATQEAIQMAAGDTNVSKTQIGLDVASQFLPGSVGLEAEHLAESAQRGIMASANPAVRIPGEVIGNMKAFQGVPIESQRLRSLPGELRYDSTTGKTYRRLGEGLNKIPGMPDWAKSPKVIQHAVEGLFNTPGRIAVGGLDKLQAPTSINVDELDTAKKVPLFGQFLGGVVRGGRDEVLSRGIDKIYTLAKEAREEVAALRTQRGGDRELAKWAKPLEATTRKLSALRRRREAIISGELKVDNPAESLRKLREQETQLVERALERLTKAGK